MSKRKNSDFPTIKQTHMWMMRKELLKEKKLSKIFEKKLSEFEKTIELFMPYLAKRVKEAALLGKNSYCFKDIKIDDLLTNLYHDLKRIEHIDRWKNVTVLSILESVFPKGYSITSYAGSYRIMW